MRSTILFVSALFPCIHAIRKVGVRSWILNIPGVNIPDVWTDHGQTRTVLLHCEQIIGPGWPFLKYKMGFFVSQIEVPLR